MLAHPGVPAPGPRLALVVRSWVGLAETTALTWLETRAIPRTELEAQLVHDFMALAAVTAAYDPETRRTVVRIVAQEPADGVLGELIARLTPHTPLTHQAR